MLIEMMQIVRFIFCIICVHLPNCEGDGDDFDTIGKFLTMKGAHWWIHNIWNNNLAKIKF